MSGPSRRRGGPTTSLLIDLVRDSVRTRTILTLLVVLVTVVAASVGAAAKYVAPWAIYVGL